MGTSGSYSKLYPSISGYLSPLSGNSRHYFPPNNFTYYLTLFSKFFSSFPQGTCLLPVSSSYLSLHETYHPLCTPFPKSVILKMHTVHEELIMTNRNITLIAALFQEACIQAPIGNAFQHYMSKPKAPIIKMS